MGHHLFQLGSGSNTSVPTSSLSWNKMYHHFRFDAGHPGTVFAKISTDAEEVEFNLLKCRVEDLPKQSAPSIIPAGLPLQRQWYLYNKIQEYVKDTLQDVVCPLPVESIAAAHSGSEDENPVVSDGMAESSVGKRRGRGRGKTFASR